MDKVRKVNVVSARRGTIGIVEPQFGINRVWYKKGTVLQIEFDKLEEALYHPGVGNLFREGYLYIESMQDKIDLGLEPAEATKPINIVVLTEPQIVDVITKMSSVEAEKLLGPLPNGQLEDICAYAVQHELMPSVSKNAYLKNRAGVDIIKTIQFNAEIKEAEAKENAK